GLGPMESRAQHGLDLLEQGRCLERFRQEAFCSAAYCICMRGRFRECSYENEWYGAAARSQRLLQFDTAHRGHPKVGNDTGGPSTQWRPEEILRRSKGANCKFAGP